MFDNRKFTIRFAFFLVGVVFILRLFYLQILDDTYQDSARTNSLKRLPDYPYRGLMYDRKGKLIVNNQPVFDIYVVPREVKNLDTLAFCEAVGMELEDFRTAFKTAKTYSRVKASPILRQLSQAEAGRVQERIGEFLGFRMVPRTVRNFEFPSLAHTVGYLGEITRKQLKDSLKRWDYYQIGDYLGVSGLEKQYERELRGKRGIRFVMVDVHGAEKGPFRDGLFDSAKVVGKDLQLSIDIDLQQYGEKLMVNKAGSVVAIEPQTGEILAMVNSPSYDPNLLSGRNFGKNFAKLSRDSTRPLLNRAIGGRYPPGSIFKTLQALIALEMGVIDSNFTYPCNKSIVNCHPHPNPCNLRQAIQWSCNPYFVQVYRRIINQDKFSNTFVDTRVGYDKWLDYVKPFGVGERLGLDFPDEPKGTLRPVRYFDKVYGANRWKYSNIYSMSIGQGEINLLPVQMANIAATIANKGWYKTPHFVRSIGNAPNEPDKYAVKHEVPINPRHFEKIHQGMQLAVEYGTVWSWARLKGVNICGKTGTAQNPAGKDHSIFICFAPRENPKIAIATVVENSGFGGFVAAPIASLMVEKYLKDSIGRKNLETHMLNQEFMGHYRNKTAR